MNTPRRSGGAARQAALLLPILTMACAYPANSWQAHGYAVDRTVIAAGPDGRLDARPGGDRPGVIVIEPSGAFTVREEGRHTVEDQECVGSYNLVADVMELFSCWLVAPTVLIHSVIDMDWRGDLRAYSDVSNSAALIGCLPLISVLGQSRGACRTIRETTEPWERQSQGEFPTNGVFELAWISAAGVRPLGAVNAADGPTFDLSAVLASLPGAGLVRLRVNVRGADPPIATTVLVPWRETVGAVAAGSTAR